MTIPSDATQLRMHGGDVTVADKEKRFSFTPYSGQRVSHWHWGEFMFEVSSMKLRKSKIPALVDHDTNRVAGTCDSVENDGQSFTLSGALRGNDHAAYVMENKDLMECSLRFNPDSTDILFIDEGESTMVNGSEQAGPLYVFKNAEVMETSFTLFGHVPDTDVKLRKQEKSVTKESLMADNTPTQVEIEASAKKELQTQFSQMKSMCDDIEFVSSCFSEGMSITEFSAKVNEKLKNELKTAKESIVSLSAECDSLKEKLSNSQDNGASAFQGSDDDGSANDGDFMTEVHAFAKSEKCSMSKALCHVAKSQPDLYKKFRGEK